MQPSNPIRSAAIIAFTIASPALGQSIGGSGASVDARCGGSDFNHPYALDEAASISRHGVCPAGEGLASINDAAASWLIGNGGFIFEASAVTDFFGTHSDAGSAAAIHDVFFSANDVVFTNIANPSQTGIITLGGMHYLVGGVATTSGLSNCSPFRPSAIIVFNFSVGPCHGSGAHTVQPDLQGGESTTGAFVGYPNDGSLAPQFSSGGGGGVNLVFPATLDLIMGARGDVLDCDFPPAEVQSAHAMLRWSLPCGEPVFDLPRGYTVNSAQLGIVNNIRVGASISSQPSSASACPSSGAASFSIAISSPDPVAYRWQWRRTGEPSWIDVVADENTDGVAAFDSPGGTAPQLDVTAYHALAGGAPPQSEFQCVVIAMCGDITSGSAALTFCAADTSCDGSVDIDDLLAVINSWGFCPGPGACPADVAPPGGDGIIDIDDLLTIINGWGACP